MFELTSSLKRQIEILGLVIADPGKYSSADIEYMFDCSEATLKRDLKSLRAEGIDIHSVSKLGLKVMNNIDNDVIARLLEIYLLISQTEASQNKAVSFIVNKKKESALALIVLLQRCINEKLQVEIEYKKRDGAKSSKRVLSPLLIFEKDNDWRLYAVDEKSEKQFLIEKIQSVRMLETKFEHQDTNYRKFIKNSFGPWVGKPEIKIQLKFSKDWLASGKEPHLMDGQETISLKDGSKVVTFMVSKLEDVARWVVGRGGEVIVLEPRELNEMVRQIAKECFDGHS